MVACRLNVPPGNVRPTDGVEGGGVGRELAVDDLLGRHDLHLLRSVGRGVPGHGPLGLVGADAQHDAGERGGVRRGRGHRGAAQGHSEAQERRGGASGHACY